jgi:hypothetical protein
VELTIGIGEGAKNLSNPHQYVHRPAVDVFVVAGVAVEAGVEVASKHDAHL